MMESAPGNDPAPPRASLGSRLRKNAPARYACRFLLALGVLALAVPFIPLSPPARPRLLERLQPPGFQTLWRESSDVRQIAANDPLGTLLLDLRFRCFGDGEIGPVLGTDALGRCVLSRLLWGARLSLAVGLAASLVSLALGVLYGGIAGYAGGRTDQIMMRFVDVLYALPLMFMVMFIVAILRGLREQRPDIEVSQVLVLFMVIGAISWLTLARIVRSGVLSLRRSEFVLAARACGTPPGRILSGHILPNVMPLVLVALSLTVPRVMLFEAYLSFLGLGVEAPDVSWGLLARQGYDAMTAVHTSPWLIYAPGVAFLLTLLSMNVLGDGLRDALDPRLRARSDS